MEPITVGSTAPPFRLPAAQGGEVALEDFRGKRNAIVWFTKGLACPFCRQHMSHLARAHDRFRELGAEILEVTATPPARARAYASRFTLRFPYLCDPDYSARRAWGLGFRRHGPLWYAKTFLAGMRMEAPPNDFGMHAPSFAEMPQVLADEDMGFFLVDREGVVRYALAGAYASAEGIRSIPTNDEIIRELERLQ